MTRSILPPFLRRQTPSGRLSTLPQRSRVPLPPTPAIDPWMACGVCLVELARMAEEKVR